MTKRGYSYIRAEADANRERKKAAARLDNFAFSLAEMRKSGYSYDEYALEMIEEAIEILQNELKEN